MKNVFELCSARTVSLQANWYVLTLLFVADLCNTMHDVFTKYMPLHCCATDAVISCHTEHVKTVLLLNVCLGRNVGISVHQKVERTVQLRSCHEKKNQVEIFGKFCHAKWCNKYAEN